MSPPKMGPKKRSIKIAGKFKKNDINWKEQSVYVLIQISIPIIYHQLSIN